MSEGETYLLYVMGAGAVGKSSLTVQLIQGRFSDAYDPTIENSYTKLLEVDGDNITLNILDTAGQEDFSCMRDAYMRQGQGFLLVFSLADEKSFDAINGFIEQIRETSERKDVPIVVCANKADIVPWKVAEDDIKSYCDSVGVKYFTTSAKTGQNVYDSFAELVRMMRKQNPNAVYSKKEEPKKGTKTADNAKEPSKQKTESGNGCCRI